MTRGQYIALVMIGGIAIVAYLQSYEVARYFKVRGIDLKQPKETTV